jgi:hypothetical protein
MKGKTVCGWCGLIMKAGEKPVSHGICSECLKKPEKEIDEKSKFNGETNEAQTLS